MRTAFHRDHNPKNPENSSSSAHYVTVTGNPLSREIVDAAFRVHRNLGPGLLESVYESALSYELKSKGIPHSRRHPVPVTYAGEPIQTAFHADLLVNNDIIVEIKAVEAIHPVHKRQLLTYLRLARRPLGLLINFNVVLIKQGITRIVNGPQPPSSL